MRCSGDCRCIAVAVDEEEEARIADGNNAYGSGNAAVAADEVAVVPAFVAPASLLPLADGCVDADGWSLDV